MDDKLEHRIDEEWDWEHRVPIPIGNPLRRGYTQEHGVDIPLDPQKENYIVEHGVKISFDYLR